MTSRKDAEATEAPEAMNREQQDEAQVLDIADMQAKNETIPVGESVHGRPNDPAQVIADDVPDLIDRMEEMVRSGHIDTSAFAGEPIHDDEESSYGGEDDTDEPELWADDRQP